MHSSASPCLVPRLRLPPTADGGDPTTPYMCVRAYIFHPQHGNPLYMHTTSAAHRPTPASTDSFSAPFLRTPVGAMEPLVVKLVHTNHFQTINLTFIKSTPSTICPHDHDDSVVNESVGEMEPPAIKTVHTSHAQTISFSLGLLLPQQAHTITRAWVNESVGTSGPRAIETVHVVFYTPHAQRHCRVVYAVQDKHARTLLSERISSEL